MSENESHDVWTRIWSQTRFDLLPEWDEQSELVYQILRFANKDFRGMLMLEEGSGTGRISLRLAKDGKVTLLDISAHALRSSKNRARNVTGDAHFIKASIFHLPFKECSLDLVWNSGVLEHYGFDKQQQAIHDALRVLRRKGLLVVIVPNKKAVFYSFFRNLDIKLGRWKFGYEEPVSQKELNAFSPKPDSHFSVGILYQFRFINLPTISFLLHEIMNHLLFSVPLLTRLDKTNVNAGYLLGGVWVKRTG